MMKKFMTHHGLCADDGFHHRGRLPGLAAALEAVGSLPAVNGALI